MKTTRLLAPLLASIAAVALLALTAAGLATAGGSIPPPYTIQAASEPGPPFPGVPSYGALVHLKASSCNQRVSVTIKTAEAGGRGLLLVSDRGGPAGDFAFHWATSQIPWLSDGRIYAGFWYKIDFHAPGSYTLTYASSDCTAGTSTNADGSTVGLFNDKAATIKITITG